MRKPGQLSILTGHMSIFNKANSYEIEREVKTRELSDFPNAHIAMFPDILSH